jgi:tetratricopeptide (TPR) repeat protein
LGKDHPDTAQSYNNIGLVYYNQEDYAKALEYYQEALDIQEKVLGKEHPHTATSYNNIGVVYANQEDYVKALEYFQKSLVVREKVLGKEHPDTAQSYNNIGLVYDHQGNYARALEYFQKSLVILEKVLGENHPDTAASYNNIGAVYDDQGDYAKTLVWYEKSLAIREKVLGKDHPDTATTYKNIALFYSHQDNYSEAINYYRKAGIENVLEMLACFNEAGRKKIIEQNLLNNLLDTDPYFRQIIGNVGDSEKYKPAYLQSIYIIGILHINNENEKKVAYYTQKNVADKMFFKEKNESSKFRLNSINYSNDPMEGLVLLDCLFKDKKPMNNQMKNPYRAFAGCFTFNHDSLNQFRLYGKEENKECTGVSIVFKNSLFEKSAKLGTQLQNKDDMKISKKIKEDKYALFRCIYIDTKTDRVVSVGHKEDFLFHREGKSDKIIKDYNKEIESLIRKLSVELRKLQKIIKENIRDRLDENILSQLLINLRYLTKHVAFKEEQECRIVKIENVNAMEVKTSENKKQMYLEYLEIGQHVEKIYFAPNASDMNIFQDRLLNEDMRIECIKSENPFA